MTTTFSITDDRYSANDATGRQRIFGTCSIGVPYTAGGDAITVSSYFPTKFLGGKVVGINPSTSVQAAGIAHTGTFRADPSSTTTVYLQLFNAGLTATAQAGLFVDSTIHVQSCTVYVEMFGY